MGPDTPVLVPNLHTMCQPEMHKCHKPQTSSENLVHPKSRFTPGQIPCWDLTAFHWLHLSLPAPTQHLQRDAWPFNRAQEHAPKKKRKQIKKRGSELPRFHTKQQRTDVHAWDLTSGKQSSPRSTIPGTQTCQHTNSGINIKEGNDAWPEDQHLRELVREFPLQEDPSPQPGISTSMEGDAAIPPGGNQVGFFVSSRLWVWKRASLPPAARSLAQRDELPKAPGTGGSFA